LRVIAVFPRRRTTSMPFTLATASYQNVQILLKLALMLVCDLLVHLQKLWSRWETKLLRERLPLKQVQMFRGTGIVHMYVVLCSVFTWNGVLIFPHFRC
jgi:hypothetical protein